MHSTGDLIKDLYNKYFSTNKMVVFKVTNKCNIECEHCRENSGPDRNDLLSSDHIKKVFDQIDDSWIITLQGGEPSLYLDKCKEIIDIAKSKNIQTVFYSNGWWANNEDMCNKIFNLDTDIIVISINKWTSKIIPIENANTIADKIKDLKQTLIYSECYEFNPVSKQYLNNDSFVIEYEIDYSGRAKMFTGTRLVRSLCKRSGFTLETDGEVYGNCCFSSNGCHFGHIDNININNFLERRNLGGSIKCLGQEKN